MEIDLISVTFSSQHNGSYPSHSHSRQLCTCSWGSLSTACRKQGVKKEPCPHRYQGFMHLLLTATTDHKKTLTQRQQVGSHCCHMSPTLASPFIAYWSDFQIFKDPVSFASLSIFAFSPFRRQTSNLGHAQMGEIRWLCLPRERLRKTWEDLQFTYLADPQTLQQSKH